MENATEYLRKRVCCMYLSAISLGLSTARAFAYVNTRRIFECIFCKKIRQKIYKKSNDN